MWGVSDQHGALQASGIVFGTTASKKLVLGQLWVSMIDQTACDRGGWLLATVKPRNGPDPAAKGAQGKRQRGLKRWKREKRGDGREAGPCLPGGVRDMIASAGEGRCRSAVPAYTKWFFIFKIKINRLYVSFYMV